MNTNENTKNEHLSKLELRRDIKNKDLVQSYVMTIARYEANIYVKRILTCIIDANQSYIKGEKLTGFINIEKDLFKEREYVMNAKDILLSPDDKNYKRVYDAFQYLQTKFYSYDDEEIMASVPFITAVLIEKHSGVIRFKMSELIMKAFTNYTKGFRKYELKISLLLTSIYSIRMYEFLSGQAEPQTRTIEWLKDMFGLHGKYKATRDFILKVIQPTKEELDKKAPYTFHYRLNKTGRKVTSITFLPIYQPQFRDMNLDEKDLQKQLSTAFVDKEVKKFLRDYFDFTNLELRQNFNLFTIATSLLGEHLLELLDKIKPRANRAKNPKGYIINSIKKELENRDIKY